jgi:hypothetical protein
MILYVIKAIQNQKIRKMALYRANVSSSLLLLVHSEPRSQFCLFLCPYNFSMLGELFHLDHRYIRFLETSTRKPTTFNIAENINLQEIFASYK